MNVAKYSAALKAMMREPQSTMALSAYLGITLAVASRLMNQLRKDGLAYVHHWERDSGGKSSIAWFKFCSRRTPDAVRPKQTSQERNKKRIEQLATINRDRVLLGMAPLGSRDRKPLTRHLKELTNGPE